MNTYTNIDRTCFKILQFNDLFLFPENINTAVVRDDFNGFKEDYITLHLILKKYMPKSLIEIGTNIGMGTNIICNALKDSIIYSIDLPSNYDMSAIYSSISPEDGRPTNIGACCKFKYNQLYGNSKEFDFSCYYPLEAWFIDGKHNYEYVSADTASAIKSSAKLIIWHDTQIDEVRQAIVDNINLSKYELYYVENTRISFAIIK